MLGVSTAEAQQAQSFHVPRRPVAEALLEVALQARHSIGGDIGACRGTAAAVSGAMSLDHALARVLAGSGCEHSILPSGGILIRRARAAAPPPRPRPAPPPPAPVSIVTDPGAIETELGDVVVTAERQTSLPQTSPNSITAMNQERLTASGVTDMNSLEAFVAGMTVTNLGSGRNKILLRGMSDGTFTGLTQSTVGLYLDTAPITYSAPDPDLKLVDLDRVEVMRGPQGVLYGTGPIGGVVRIVTRQPDFLDRSFEIRLNNSITRAGGPNSDYSATANLPLFGGRVAIRGNLYEEAFGGYINDVSLDLRRVNDGSRRGGRLAIAGQITPEWTLTAGYVHQSIDAEDTHYVYRTLGGLRRANLVREPHDNDFDESYATLVGQGDWGRLDASFTTVSHSFESRYDASVALPAFGSTGRLGALDDRKNIDLDTGELVFAPNRSGKTRWLFGAAWSSSETASRTRLVELRPVFGLVYLEMRNDTVEEGAVFGQGIYDLRPDWTLTAGARISRIDYATDSDVSQNGVHRRFQGDRQLTSVSPMVSIAYEPNENLNLYAQISQGRRSAGFNTAGPISQNFSGQIGSPARAYNEDRLTNFEIGAKALWWDGRVQARAAAFFADWQDIQSDQFLPSGLSYAVNIGDGRNLGIEIEANWQVTEELEIRSNALFAHPEVTSPSVNFNSRNSAGLPGVPEGSANISAEYRRPFFRSVILTGQASLNYVGQSRLTFDAERRYRMGQYITARASIGLEAAHWSASMFVDNPFDTEANTFSYGDPFRLPEALASTPLKPRTVGIALVWRD